MTKNNDLSIEQSIQRLARMNQRWMEPRLAELGLTSAQLPVLEAIKSHGPMSQTELARLLHVEQPSMAQLLSRMERDGLIERVTDSADKRSSTIHLTKLAKDRARSAQRVLQAGRKTLQATLNEQELATLDDLLGRMLANMENALTSDRG